MTVAPPSERQSRCNTGLPLQYREGHVQHFIEKPDWEHVVTDLVNTGIYIVSRGNGHVPEDQLFDFCQRSLPLLLAAHEPILGVPMDGYWCDIGTPRAYYRCSLDVLDGRLSPAQPDAPGITGSPSARRPEARRSVLAATARNGCTRSRKRYDGAGADFTDGLHLRDGGWELSIRLDANVPALQVGGKRAVDAAAETARLLEAHGAARNQSENSGRKIAASKRWSFPGRADFGRGETRNTMVCAGVHPIRGGPCPLEASARRGRLCRANALTVGKPPKFKMRRFSDTYCL